MKSVLNILQAELDFLRAGGYRRNAANPPLIFEDSPTCLKNTRAGRGHTCLDCPLIDFVPVASQKAEYPCRHIRLSADGETLDSLYRWGEPEEVEGILEEWLVRKIEELRSQLQAPADGPSCHS